ncbi:PucR family transcriptional regulator ligand-binding domain-containing protein [Terrilactibacillus sp. S3-3]|nr:PucR family transcriptional regulator ligand-binding domain-containing protein [Terrilactibacillus sp. S3-3]
MKREIPFCIKDVLERPLFHRAKLVAGKNGLNREVKWLHILEVTNAAPYVSKNDLILTTGIWLKRSVEEGLAYMQQIIDHETAGLCIEFGTTIDEIPDELIRLCDEHDFPIILFRQPVRFEEITQDIHSFLVNRHINVLRNLEGFSRKQQQLILQSSDIPAILRLLHKIHIAADHLPFFDRSSRISFSRPSILRRRRESMLFAARNWIKNDLNKGRIFLKRMTSNLFCFNPLFVSDRFFLMSALSLIRMNRMNI